MKNFLLGLGVGLGLGVLFAHPEAGDASRRKLKQYASDALDAITDEFSDQTKQDENDQKSNVRTADSEIQEREKLLHRSLAESFPSSDPPSSISDPLRSDREVA